MSLIKLTIRVPDICTAMEDFNYIEIYYSTTKFGTYTKITTPGTRPRLCENETGYQFSHKTGEIYYWYRWRAFNSSTGLYSAYSEPFMGVSSGSKYVPFSDVDRILSTGEKRIGFSDSWKNLKAGRNTGDIMLDALTIFPTYAGHQRFTITFSDATNFSVTVSKDRTIEPTNIGSGIVGSDFTSTDETLFIPSSGWSGTAVANDTITFETDSAMSITDAMEFIREAEYFVDAILEANLPYQLTKDLYHRFNYNSVPKAIRFATSRFAAFFIYTTIYNEQQFPGMPSSIHDITVPLLKRSEDLSTWPKQAMLALHKFIEKYESFFDPESGEGRTTSPRWWSSDTLFDGQGVYGVGEGLKLPDFDVFMTRNNQSYQGLLDWDLLWPLIQDLPVTVD